MKRWLIILLICSLGLYWYASVGRVCAVPLSYTITGYDERFPLPEADMLAAIETAEAVWETPAGRTLFTKAASGTEADVTILFQFDDRQERVTAEATLRDALGDKEATTEALTSAYDELVASYEARTSTYEAAVAAYDRAVAQFNARVDAVAETGVSNAEAAALEAEEQRLNTELQRLDTEAAALAQLAADINEIGAEGNALIRQYNQNVGEYNRRFADSEEFTQGEYGSGDITIFSFADETELIAVVAHELGHALGIDHVEGSESVMYYLLEDQPTPLMLSAADTAAFIAACGQSESIHTRVRTLINSFL